MKQITVSAAVILRTNPQTHKKEILATQRGYGGFGGCGGAAMAISKAAGNFLAERLNLAKHLRSALFGKSAKNLPQKCGQKKSLG